MSEAPAITPQARSEPQGAHDADVHSFQARYLYGFRFDVSKVEAIEGRLLADTFSTLKGKAARLWEPPSRRDDGHYSVDHVYRDELLHAVTKYLFSERSAQDCRSYRVDPVLINTWFEDLHGQWRERQAIQRVPVKLVDSARIELFLSPQGVGVLSIAMEIAPREMRLDQIVATHYRIAQFRRRKEALEFRRIHPSDDAERWERMPDEARQQVRVVTPEDPFEVRVQSPGGTFSLVEVVDRLLEPLKQVGSDVVSLQDELCAFAVLRLKSGVDFDRRVDRDHWCTWMARIAQLEEAYHPSCGPNSMHLAEAVLNRLHWVAASQLGVANIIADESPHRPGDAPSQFVEQKPGIVRDKYFVPYLIALLQKLTMHSALHDARQIASAAPAELGEKLAVFRRELLQFGVRGYFAQVSTRDALHRFYQLVQRGLDVPTNWQVLQRSLQELESSVNAQQQREAQTAQLREQQLLVEQQKLLIEQQSLERKFTQSMDDNLHEIRSVQTFIHFLEYPLISVYFAHLWHMYAETRWPDDHDFVSTGVLVAAVLGFLVVFACDRYGVATILHELFHKGKGSHSEKPDRDEDRGPSATGGH